MPRPGGNPDIAHAGEPHRWQVVAEGEPTVAITVRILKSQLDRLDQLPGSKSERVRAAIEAYLQSKTL